jgi:hypothetical protein
LLRKEPRTFERNFKQDNNRKKAGAGEFKKNELLGLSISSGNNYRVPLPAQRT